jgi:hypothetical protein
LASDKRGVGITGTGEGRGKLSTVNEIGLHAIDHFPYEFALHVVHSTERSPGWPYWPPPYIWKERVGEAICRGDRRFLREMRSPSLTWMLQIRQLVGHMDNLTDLLRCLTTLPLSARRSAW